MKKYLLLAILAVTALGVRAEYNKLEFRTLDGAVKTVGLTDLSITFENGELVATSGDDAVTLPLSTLESMEFVNDNSGVALPTAEVGGAVTVYDVDGKSVGQFPTALDAVNSLSNGVYLIKSENGKTSKVLINR